MGRLWLPKQRNSNLWSCLHCGLDILKGCTNERDYVTSEIGLLLCMHTAWNFFPRLGSFARLVCLCLHYARVAVTQRSQRFELVYIICAICFLFLSPAESFAQRSSTVFRAEQWRGFHGSAPVGWPGSTGVSLVLLWHRMYSSVSQESTHGRSRDGTFVLMGILLKGSP